jgi:hypothetical protein
MTSPTATPNPTSTQTPIQTATPTSTTPPSTNPFPSTVVATTNTGKTVDLTVAGNVTCSQMSNATIATNESASTTTLSFTITGQGGTGFGNISIPLNEVAYGTTPTIYIDNQTAQNQGYCQDSRNYYVWYTTYFSTHEVSIVFNKSSSIPEFSSSIILSMVIILAASTLVVLTLRKYKIVKS